MPKEERGFKYQRRTKDDLKERANMKGGNYDTYIKPKFKQWKPKDGKNLIRILPPTWKDARHYGLDIFVNFNIGADNQSYLSLSKHERGNDPLSEARREAQQEGDKALAKALNPSQRILYWMIDRTDEDEGPLLWAAPFTFDKSLSNLCIDEDTKDVIFIDDPAKGRDVRFYKEGSGLTTKYDPSKMKVLKESNIHEDEGIEQDWLDFVADNPLPEVLNFYDYEHIKATFNGQAGRTEDDDDKPEPRTSRRSRIEDDEKPARSTRKPIRDSEDDEGTKRTRNRSGEEADADDKPARSRRSDTRQDEDGSDEKQTRRGPRRDQEDGETDDAPVRSRSRPDRESDDKPATRSRSRARDTEDDDKPVERSRTRARVADPDDDDINDSPKGGRGGSEENGSLRERLARRRVRENEDDDIPF